MEKAFEGQPVPKALCSVFGCWGPCLAAAELGNDVLDLLRPRHLHAPNTLAAPTPAGYHNDDYHCTLPFVGGPINPQAAVRPQPAEPQTYTEYLTSR